MGLEETIDLVGPNFGLKLDYISPLEHNEVKIQCIEASEIQLQIEFWSSSTACSILRANPLIQVIEGFLRRLWGNRGFNRATVKADGVFIVGFHSMLEGDEVLNQNFAYFDKKILIM